MRLGGHALWRATLYSVPLLDELGTGLLVVALPLLRAQFGLNYAQTGLLFTAGALASLLLEPVINLLSDRGTKRVPIVAGMLCLTAGFALAGVGHTFALLLLAFAVIYPATGAASLAQAALVDDAPARGGHILAHWTLLASIGDLLGPLAVAALVGTGQGWTTLCLLGAGLWALAVVAGVSGATLVGKAPPPAAIATQGAEASSGEQEAELRVGLLVGMLAGLRAALGSRPLLRWEGVALLASMLDEVFVAFVALYLHDTLRVGAAGVGVLLAVHMAGGILGALALGRLVRHVPGERILPAVLLGATAGVALLLAVHALWVVGIALFFTGLAVSSWYPIARAATYAALPGRSGTVQAVAALGAPFEMALPAVVGLVAGQWGLVAALAVLGSGPLGALLLAPRGRTSRGPAREREHTS